MTSSPPTSWYRKIYHNDNYRCVYCGKDMLKVFDLWLSLEVDHIIPQSKGGNNEPNNLVTSCNVCNKYKSSYLSKLYKSDITVLNEPKKRNAILNDIRKHILNKRLEHQIRWIEAQNDYENNIIMEVDENGNAHY